DAGVVRRARDRLSPPRAAFLIEQAQRSRSEPRRHYPAVRLLDVVGVVGNRCQPEPPPVDAVDAQRAAFPARDEDELTTEREVLRRLVREQLSQQAAAPRSVDRDLVSVARAHPDPVSTRRPADVVREKRWPKAPHEP